jgi:hypothetical protein
VVSSESDPAFPFTPEGRSAALCPFSTRLKSDQRCLFVQLPVLAAVVPSSEELGLDAQRQ